MKMTKFHTFMCKLLIMFCLLFNQTEVHMYTDIVALFGLSFVYYFIDNLSVSYIRTVGR
jgi:hypothetical protein